MYMYMYMYISIPLKPYFKGFYWGISKIQQAYCKTQSTGIPNFHKVLS